VDRLYGSNGLNQLTNAGATGLGYDGRGNLTASGATTFGYNAKNQLIALNGVTQLYYEPLGRLTQQWNGGGILDWDGNEAVGERSGVSHVMTRRYVPGSSTDETVVWYEGAGLSDRRWLHADERGSITAVTDSSGAAIAVRRQNIVVDQPSQTLTSGNKLQSMLLDGSYTSEQLHNVISRCSTLATELGAAKYGRKQEILRNVLYRIGLHDDRVVITIDNRSLLNIVRADNTVQPKPANLTIERQAIRVRRGKALRLVIPAPTSESDVQMRDEKLIALIVESRTIMAQITDNPGKSIPILAAEQGRCRVRMMKVAKLACLDPDIVTAIIDGRRPPKLTPGKLLAADLPFAWAEQKRALGFG
jgi:hypothetical protein